MRIVALVKFGVSSGAGGEKKERKMLEAIGTHRLLYMALELLLETVANDVYGAEPEEVYATDDYEWDEEGSGELGGIYHD